MDIDGLAAITAIHSTLTKVAAVGDTVPYAKAMLASTGWDHKNSYQRNVFAYMLKSIAAMELGAGHPPLTVVVVSKDTGMPNKAFFDWARSEGRFRKGESDSQYFDRELARVHARWHANVEGP
jgi:hypothetical protein